MKKFNLGGASESEVAAKPSETFAAVSNAAAVLVLFAFVFTVRLLMLLKSSEPAGLDGYFYALQAKSFMLNGVLENPDHKTGYYFCGIFAWLFRNPVLGCKIYASFVSAVLVLAVYSVLASLKVKSQLCFLGAMVCAGLFSVSSMCINYINNLTGLTFFLFYCAVLFSYGEAGVKAAGDEAGCGDGEGAGIVCVEGAAEGEDAGAVRNSFFGRQKIPRLILLAVLFVLCVLSHLVSAAFVFLITVFYVLNRFSLKKQLAFVLFALLAGSLIFVRQLPRFKGVFSLLPVLPCFSDFMQSAIGKRVCVELSAVFVFAWIIFIREVILGIKNRHFSFINLMIPALFFPFWNLNVLDMGYRMLLSAVPFGIIIIFYQLNRILQVLGKSKNQTEDLNHIGSGYSFGTAFAENSRKTFAFILIVVLLVPAVISTRSAYNEKRDPPYAYYRKVVRSIELPDDSLLIAHLGLNHVYTYYKNLRDALNYEPDFYVPVEKLWRIAYGVNPAAIAEKLEDEPEEVLKKLVKPIDRNYILIREDMWKKFLEREDEEIAENFKNWYNPYTVRPNFIRKSKNKK